MVSFNSFILLDVDGNPTDAFVYSDAMTESKIGTDEGSSALKKQTTRVCEAAFLILLGYIKSTNASSANHMWHTYKKKYFDHDKTLKDIRANAAMGHVRRKSRKFIKIFIHLVPRK